MPHARAILRSVLACIAAVCQTALSTHVHVAVVAQWENHDHWPAFAKTIGSCFDRVQADALDDIVLSLGYYLGTYPAEVPLDATLPIAPIVAATGPDADPPGADLHPRAVKFERWLVSRYFTIAQTMRSLPEAEQPDWVLVLRDTTFADIPGILRMIQDLQAASPEAKIYRTYVGHLRTEETSPEREPYCLGCDPETECPECTDWQLRDWCKQFGTVTSPISLGWCVLGRRTCSKIYELGTEELDKCMRRRLNRGLHEAYYYGSSDGAPYPMRFGFAMTRDLWEYIDLNRDLLKFKGEGDRLIGYWTLSMEGVTRVDVSDRFHMHPEVIHDAARACSERTLLVGELTPEHWATVDHERCELRCPTSLPEHEALRLKELKLE